MTGRTTTPPRWAERRRAFAQAQSSTSLTHVGHYSIDPLTVRGNVENLMAVTQVPIGLDDNTIEVPPGSIVGVAPRLFVFVRTTDNVPIALILAELESGLYRIDVEAFDDEIAAVTNPVDVSLAWVTTAAPQASSHSDEPGRRKGRLERTAYIGRSPMRHGAII